MTKFEKEGAIRLLLYRLIGGVELVTQEFFEEPDGSGNWVDQDNRNTDGTVTDALEQARVLASVIRAPVAVYLSVPIEIGEGILRNEIRTEIFLHVFRPRP